MKHWKVSPEGILLSHSSVRYFCFAKKKTKKKKHKPQCGAAVSHCLYSEVLISCIHQWKCSAARFIWSTSHWRGSTLTPFTVWSPPGLSTYRRGQAELKTSQQPGCSNMNGCPLNRKGHFLFCYGWNMQESKGRSQVVQDCLCVAVNWWEKDFHF